MNRIFNFHEVHDAHWFESVVLLLRKKYQMVSAQDIYNYFYNGKNLKNACLITVDDGHETSYRIIYPILKKYDISAIFFVSPMIAKNTSSSIFWFQAIKNCRDEKFFSEIKEKNLCIDDIWNKINQYAQSNDITLDYGQNMTVDQIKKIDTDGLVTIGAHTMTHPFLSRETEDRSRSEIINSIDQLELLLGHPILFFAYPNGRPILDWGNREVDILKETSVKISFSTKNENFSHKNNPYAIPRFGLSRGSMKFVKMKIFFGKYYIILKSLKKRVR